MENSKTLIIDNGTDTLITGIKDTEPLTFSNYITRDTTNNSTNTNNTKNKNNSKNKFILGGTSTNSTKRSMFTHNIITNQEVFEITIDKVLEEIYNKNYINNTTNNTNINNNNLNNNLEFENLIMTVPPCFPNYYKNKIIQILFEVYNFKNIQFGYDSVYSANYNNFLSHNITTNINTNITNSNLKGIVKSSHSETNVIFLTNEIKKIYTLPFGYNSAEKLFNETLKVKFDIKSKLNLNTNTNTTNLNINTTNKNLITDHLRVSLDYKKESEEILNECKNKNFSKSVDVEIFKKNLNLKNKNLNINNKNISSKNLNISKNNSSDSIEEDYNNSDSSSNSSINNTSSSSIIEYKRSERVSRKITKNINTNSNSNTINNTNLDNTDNINTNNTTINNINNKDTTNNLNNTAKLISELRKNKLKHFGKLYWLKTTIQKHISKLHTLIINLTDTYHLKSDPDEYLAGLKEKFNELNRKMGEQSLLRRKVETPKTFENHVYNKYKDNFINISNTTNTTNTNINTNELESSILSKLTTLHTDFSLQLQPLIDKILKIEPDFSFINYSTFGHLSGASVGRNYVNLDLIRIPEVLFEPGVFCYREKGVREIFSENFAVNSISNNNTTNTNTTNNNLNITNSLDKFGKIFVTGGFSLLTGFDQRIEHELRKVLPVGHCIINSNNNVQYAADRIYDSYYGAEFLDLFDVMRVEEFRDGFYSF